MNEFAELHWDGSKAKLPLIEGSAGERAVDISKLRDQTGLITLDSGYGNTGSCRSAITFIDGEKGILRYRGIPIEVIAEQSSFIENEGGRICRPRQIYVGEPLASYIPIDQRVSG